MGGGIRESLIKKKKNRNLILILFCMRIIIDTINLFTIKITVLGGIFSIISIIWGSKGVLWVLGL
jgi:hypothetical protein